MDATRRTHLEEAHTFARIAWRMDAAERLSMARRFFEAAADAYEAAGFRGFARHARANADRVAADIAARDRLDAALSAL